MQPGKATEASRTVTTVNIDGTTTRRCFNPNDIKHISELNNLSHNGKTVKGTTIKLMNGSKYAILEPFDTVVQSYDWLQPITGE